ncbi:site-specific integrase [Herminiimonas contaminans]|uniref:Phage integrase family protein n=1 Tax=Herminiimonas contaminans TaxID=1111140 RepID=A0ABS0ET70_9BURK|nr:hypothetical protein [Herminiimonas contaminans]MBF8178041.1 hypothetical protein [Herminiimonas contaminans]
MGLDRKIRLSWHQCGGLRLVAYDLIRNQLVPELMDYADHLSQRESLSSKTVINEIVLLKSLFEFLIPNFSIKNINDSLLLKFRDLELSRTLENKISRGSEVTARRTVNMKLRRAYLFIIWCQESQRLSSGSIGAYNCKVTARCDQIKGIKWRGGFRNNATNDFPLLYRKAQAGIGPDQGYFATDSDRSALGEYFARNGTTFTFTRNVLLMDIADAQGWRRGSINSLKCAQFSAGEGSSEKIRIAPAKQKFGYGWFFEVEFALANRILNFINIERALLLAEMGWDEARTEDHIFISARNGKPLTDQAISRIFGNAFKVIGRPKGAGLHSFRRKFAECRVVDEIQRRLTLGMDTSALSIAASVAVELGHAHPESLKPYVSRSQSRLAGNRAKSKKEITR